MLHGRNLFRTQRGFFGVGLAGMKEGDVIVAFQNTRNLHILRQTDDGYQYVGAALLASSEAEPFRDTDGFMSDLDDLLAAVAKGRIPDSSFIIR